MPVFSKPKKFKTASELSSEPQAPCINLVENICLKCGHNQAKFRQIQIRANDEPPTEIYTCSACGDSTRPE
jgi:DNA-directed RNA polymerase subunit M/transcription elongation factor TFIIS